MSTKVIEIFEDNIDLDKLAEPAHALAEGKLVAFPTETVYGLGANALDTKAVQKIYEAKGRPSDNPLIVHIAKKDSLAMLVSEVPTKAKLLMDAFWPGPLTLVFKKSAFVPMSITAGLDTVAVRMPEHPIALELIRLAGIPVAAPSANVSGKPSPTEAKHVLEDLDGKIEYVVSGGKSRVGLESTVLDITSDIPVLLRPGGITPDQLQAVVGEIQIDKTILGKIDEDNVPRAPGMKYKHYAPKAEVTIVEGKDPLEQAINILNLAGESRRQGRKVGICATSQTVGNYREYITLSMGDRERPESIASNLFSILREFDSLGVDMIYAEAVDNSGVGLAIMNRMIKAAGYNVFKIKHE